MSTDGGDARAERIAQGKDELQKWNWGAFLWGGIWALGHKLWLKGILGIVLSFIPFAGIGVAVWFGMKGNEWAWEQGSYSGKDDLRAKERKWVVAWLLIVPALIVLYLVLVGV